MKLLRSKTGEVRSEQAWKDEMEGIWAVLTKMDDYKKVPKPVDAWERFSRVIGLEEVGLHSYKGVF